MKARYQNRLLLSAFCLLILGCGLEPATKPADDQTAKPAAANITSETKAARQQANQILRERMTSIADDVEAGRIEYDTKLELELSQANRDAAKPINEVKAKHLPTGKITDRKSTAAALRQIRDGYQ